MSVRGVFLALLIGRLHKAGEGDYMMSRMKASQQRIRQIGSHLLIPLGDWMYKCGMTEADSWEFLEGLVVLKQQGDVAAYRPVLADGP